MFLKKKERTRARYHAVQAIYQQSISHNSLDELKVQFYEDNSKRYIVEWDFFNLLLEGVYKNYLLIDNKIDTFYINNLSSINYIDLAILRLGTYEILNFLEIPYQIVLKEYVHLAQNLGTTKGYALVNALLEKIVKKYRSS